MLVLSRRASEKIHFPELGITVEVVRIKGNIVRIGIDAPKDIRVLRGELREHGQDSGPSHCYNEQETEPAVRESRAAYQVRRQPIDVAVAAANEVIAC